MVRIIAQVALEAAERVRPRRDPTNAMRSRQHRAKKRAERNVAGDGTSNVAEAGRNVAAERNVTRNVAGGETLPETFLAAAASGNAERMAVLFAKLVDAAGGNVQPGATDLGDITALLAQGCDLDLDILPAVRELVAAPGQPPLKSWGLLGLGTKSVTMAHGDKNRDRGGGRANYVCNCKYFFRLGTCQTCPRSGRAAAAET